MSDRHTRREMLKRSATGIAFAVPTMTSLSSNASATSQHRRSGSGGFQMSLSSENMQSPRQMRKIAREKAAKSSESSGILPDTSSDGEVSTMDGKPSVQQCDLVGGWNFEYWITDDITGAAYAYIDNAVVLYRSYEKTPSGRWTYLVWQWSKGEPIDSFWIDGGINYMRNKFNVQLNDIDVLKFDPSTTQEKHGENVSIGVQVGIPGGPTVGVSGSTHVADGHIEARSADVGGGGHYELEFEGHGHDEGQRDTGMNAAVVLRSERKYSISDGIPGHAFDWHCEGYYGV